MCADRLNARSPLMNMRKSKRAYGAFPVRMRGFDESGCAFKATSLADNISAGGMYLQLGRRMADGSRLFAVVRLQTGANMAARGAVTRIERRPHGLIGVAVRFTHAKLMPAQEYGDNPELP
jgi:hypothetical protein